MVARVKTHISRYKTLRSGSDAVKPEIIEIRGLKVDKGSRRVFSDGKEVIMTVKEYDLLLFLLENPNIVFNKEVLFDRGWGLEAFGDASSAVSYTHLQTVDYDPGRGDTTTWGKTSDKTNRVDRFLACTAYLDGVHPSLVTARGYYGKAIVVAYDLSLIHI